MMDYSYEDYLIRKKLLTDCNNICLALPEFANRNIRKKNIAKKRFIEKIFLPSQSPQFIDVVLRCYVHELNIDVISYKSEIDKLLKKKKYRYIPTLFLKIGGMEKQLNEYDYALIMALGLLSIFMSGVSGGKKLSFLLGIL